MYSITLPRQAHTVFFFMPHQVDCDRVLVVVVWMVVSWHSPSSLRGIALCIIMPRQASRILKPRQALPPQVFLPIPYRGTM
jgi:hypothetical protein